MPADLKPLTLRPIGEFAKKVAIPAWNIRKKPKVTIEHVVEDEQEVYNDQASDNRRLHLRRIRKNTKSDVHGPVVLDLCQDASDDEAIIQSWLQRDKQHDAMLAIIAKERIDRAIEQAGARGILG